MNIQDSGFYVTNADLNLRSSSSSTSSIVDVISKGDTVEVLGAKGSNWVKLSYKGVEGYSFNKYLQEIERDSNLSQRTLISDSSKALNQSSDFFDFFIAIIVISTLAYIFFRIGFKNKNKIGASLLALFFGGIGLHRYYLGQIGKGVLYTLFCWTFIPFVIGFIDFIILITMQDLKFNERYNKGIPFSKKKDLRNSHVTKEQWNEVVNNRHRPKIKDSSNRYVTNSQDVNNAPNDDSIFDVNSFELNLEIVKEEYLNTVPSWSHMYVYSYDDISYASKSQKAFYERYKKSFLNGQILDIEGNTNYAFILYFDLYNSFQKHQNFQKLYDQLILLGNETPKIKSYSLYLLMDILRKRTDNNSKELLSKLEDPLFQFQNGFTEYDPNAYRLGGIYGESLNLKDSEVILLNKFYYQSNVFNSIPGCITAIINLYLKVITELDFELEKQNTSIELFIEELRIILNKNPEYSNKYDYRFASENIERDFYLSVFKRTENVLRERFRHNRKISAEVYFNHENAIIEKFEDFTGPLIDKLLERFKNEIGSPDDETEIELNSQNVNRWKEEFKKIKLDKGNVESFNQEIERLEKLNVKNQNIENVFYEASKIIAGVDKTQALKFYAKYIFYDLKSDKIHNKQLTKTIQKSLFKSQDQVIEFQKIIDELMTTENIEKALQNLSGFYEPKRRKIILDKKKIQEVEDKHSNTIEILNKYLGSSESDDDITQVEKTDIVIDLGNKRKEESISKYRKGLIFNDLQKNILNSIVDNEYMIPQQAVQLIAIQGGFLKNQLIDSINEICFEVLEGEVLIEEDEENYIIEKSFYEEIIQN
ncbi:NINE protein [Leeuwenhoekiella sp. MAR_2009_132]|uniref:NINE protein n=1 Tax=Leeuwenhoekiella sp. MAR_2009_132 TaxID=1392489 RepID=UPI0009DE6CC8|nr:NINE protein [Leeuwenhoekiella sp. MAR_2009_132]